MNHVFVDFDTRTSRRKPDRIRIISFGFVFDRLKNVDRFLIFPVKIKMRIEYFGNIKNLGEFFLILRDFSKGF